MRFHSSITSRLPENNTSAQKRKYIEIIARRHGFDPKLEDSFNDWDTIENSIRVSKIFNAMDWFLGVVGMVTLGLGAIGFINIMLVSVTERTKKSAYARLWAPLTATFSRNSSWKEPSSLRSAAHRLAICVAFVTLLAQLPRLRALIHRELFRRRRWQRSSP